MEQKLPYYGKNKQVRINSEGKAETEADIIDSYNMSAKDKKKYKKICDCVKKKK